LQAWEFKHPDFKANNRDALDNIRRKAPAPRKNVGLSEDMLPTQQMDLINTQLVATQQQLQQLQERYNDLSMHHTLLIQELIGVQKTVVNHEHVMQYVMNFLQSIDAQRRRESKIGGAQFSAANDSSQTSNMQSGALQHEADGGPASPLQNAAKLLSEANADQMLNARNLEQMTEMSMRMHAALTTPPPEMAGRYGARLNKTVAAPHSATSSTMNFSEIDKLVYPVGQTNGIDPMYSGHVHNIPYSLPPQQNPTDAQLNQSENVKKNGICDPGWIRPPQVLLVEDDLTCRRIGSKFLYAFNCNIDSAVSIVIHYSMYEKSVEN